MSRARLSALCLIGLAGCATGGARGPFVYACAEAKGFTARFDAARDAVTVTAGGQTRTMPQAISASGARFADGVAEYWSKGRGATLQGFPGGPYADCATVG